VAFTSDHVGDELLESINRPFRDLPELLDALLRALAERTGLTAGALSVRGAGTLHLRVIGAEVVSDWISESLPAGDRPARADCEPGWLALPLTYAEAPLGELRLKIEPSPGPVDPQTELLRHFARQCGLLIKRYHVRSWSERRLGRPLLLVGLSKSLRELETFLEISARGRLPVLLRGEFGTEKAQLAAMIHCCGPTADGPFVQVDCAEPDGTPSQWIGRAEDGTLYLGDVDELAPRLQKQLSQYLPSVLHQWLPASAGGKVRVIASTTADLQERAREGLFSRSLLAELDFLSATIPPLRHRGGDIEPLICHALEQNGYRAEDKSTDALIAMCGTYDWPENLFELERTVARLAVLTESRPIALDDICRHAPTIVPDGLAAAAPPSGGQASARGATVDHWVGCAIAGDQAALRGLHHALRKALVNLGAHYNEPITLDQLARNAGVSPSHLGFLFRSVVGMPFKTLLGHIRIRKAREMLAAGARPNITQVAMSVGYCDLSHFERSFRRIVGQSPREFRRSAAA